MEFWWRPRINLNYIEGIYDTEDEGIQRNLLRKAAKLYEEEVINSSDSDLRNSVAMEPDQAESFDDHANQWIPKSIIS
jgi:hypothetical protein